MTTETSHFFSFSLACLKLQPFVGSEERRLNLHRWVLLKNSTIRSLPLFTATDIEDEEVSTEETDLFIFPDAEKLVDNPDVDLSDAEAQWLDSLLETLEDDAGGNSGVSQADDDEETLHSPISSPMFSSDEITTETSNVPPNGYHDQGPRMFSHNSGFTITGGQFNNVHGDQVNSVTFYAFGLLQPQFNAVPDESAMSRLLENIPILLYDQLSLLASSLDLSVVQLLFLLAYYSFESQIIQLIGGTSLYQLLG
uniref:Uncharacterized protein n=1 Tax=Moniliophthora roreri TaxID=221103 RepID=A0A0W0F636_MONRR